MLRDIKELVQQVRERPALFLGDYSVVKLFHFLNGYRMARHEAGDLAFSDALTGFQERVQRRYSITLSIDWGSILAFVSQSEARGLDLFWEMWDDHLSEKSPPDTVPAASGP